MVFLGGPRQVGKTTLALSQLMPTKTGYLNWDIPLDRDAILRRTLPDSLVLVFDELHPKKKILVTGSARLDLYRFGGDSLLS
jgi:hypothetical protein